MKRREEEEHGEEGTGLRVVGEDTEAEAGRLVGEQQEEVEGASPDLAHNFVYLGPGQQLEHYLYCTYSVVTRTIRYGGA